ncbi:oxygen-independent coproporphyrinogen III oxidase [Prevotella sp. E13-17]|uniref:oxygen-independent coproporphyrinogen III oxidase n=1 Tax=Prevotella sp. E13-17 TaxID=2913616 RepID=UPI001EDC0827|nr:oxygen-independent coproporphyrinogen III oxidase [Prevotella sp. E13-17]UKK50573.1 oxygen-independent coproporphyrinogen III oxidase [Prevotella sp. E13-17]
MQPEIIQKYNKPVPRYTSYPPANYFGNFTESDYLRAVEASDKARQNQISFYLHIPFCRHLCHYCGCNSYPAAAPETVKAYVEALHQEIDLVAKHIDRSRKIAQIHYGGGSPTSIPIEMVKELNEHLLSIAPVIERPEIAIECHPGYLNEQDWQRLTTCGFTRYSIGMQDLKEDVLKAVNRRPSLLPMKAVLDILRASGATVNFDFIYGLPHQSAASFQQTIEQAAALRPDRLVTFSYAHLPKLFPRQQILDRIGLPSVEEKNRMFEVASGVLTQAGYQRIGLDHFVLPEDELFTALQSGALHRNFQGYCTRRTTAQVYAFGVTAISQLDDAYAQNGRDIKEYIETIGRQQLYIRRGCQLTSAQKMVREVVETLMCNYYLNWKEVADRLGVSVDELRGACCYDEERLKEMAHDGIIDFDEQHIQVHSDGRPLVRCVAAALDPLVQHTDKQFSNPI